MNTIYKNITNNERVVEIAFICEYLKNNCNTKTKILDVGGIPSDFQDHLPMTMTLREINPIYKICDFRGGDYKGDFVQLDIRETFDIIIFLSSLEHFNQCPEGDKIFRDGEDRKGFEKALSLLNPNGVILLTVPFGKFRWQPYHQNYDQQGINNLTKDSIIEQEYIYILDKDNWIQTLPENTTEIIYDNKCHCVGCFVLRKQ